MAYNSGLTDTQLSARINTLGQKTSANSTSVVIASDNTITVTGTISTTGGLTDTQLRANAVAVSSPTMFDLLTLMLTELRVMNIMLQVGLNVKDTPEILREDESRQLN